MGENAGGHVSGGENFHRSSWIYPARPGLFLDGHGLGADGLAPQIKWFNEGHTMFARAATLEEAARKMGLPPATVSGTVRTYNAGQASGVDALGRQHMPLPIAEGPFYIVETYTSGVFTFAGLDVNDKLQVVTKEKTPIPNLYAAGEVIGGWQCAGDVVVNGCMVTPSITFGRLLGQALIPL
jgi:fumarate reductase flavoprotein subunit